MPTRIGDEIYYSIPEVCRMTGLYYNKIKFLALHDLIRSLRFNDGQPGIVIPHSALFDDNDQWYYEPPSTSILPMDTGAGKVYRALIGKTAQELTDELSPE